MDHVWELYDVTLVFPEDLLGQAIGLDGVRVVASRQKELRTLDGFQPILFNLIDHSEDWRVARVERHPALDLERKGNQVCVKT